MKKVLSFVCAMAVAASCTATAFAADETATPGQIVNDKAQEVVNEIQGVSLNEEHYNVVVNEVLKPAVTNDNVHISKAAADLGARAITVAANYDDGLTRQQSEVIKLQESVPAPVQAQATPAESEATVTEQPAEAVPAESTPAESKTEVEEPAESKVTEEPGEEEVSAQADEGETAPVVVESKATEEAAVESALAESKTEVEEPAESKVTEEPGEEEVSVQPGEEKSAPVAVESEAADEVSVQADDQPAQPVATAAAKEFGAVKLLTAANQDIDFSQVTGSITNDSKNIYTLTVNVPVDRSATPAGYEVTVYGLDYYAYQMVYGTDVENGARLDNITAVTPNEQDSTKWDVTFWVPHFSTYTICPAKVEEAPVTTTSSHSHSSSSYEAPEDSIYYTCPKCGYHNWTAAEGGYLCDHCGYMEVVKELAGWPNVNGVAVKTSNPASLSAVYAGAIKATGASMSMLALAVVAMAAAAVGGAAYLVRKNGLGE